MDKSKTRGGQAPFPEAPVLASLTGVIWKAVEEFYDRNRAQALNSLFALADVAGLRQWGNESHWDADFVCAHVPEGPLRDGLLKYMARADHIDEEFGQAYDEIEAMRQWYQARQAKAKADQQRAAGAGEAKQ